MTSSPLPIAKPVTGLAPSKNCMTLEKSKINGFYMATKIVEGGGDKLPVCACNINRMAALCECHKRAKRAEEGLR